MNDDLTYNIIGACIAVHRELGNGFLEKVYHQALIQEFTLQGIPFLSKPQIPVFYKGYKLPTTFEPDFLCYNQVLLEIKAAKAIEGIFEAQILNYLVATKLQRGLLINFGTSKLEFKRFVNGYLM